jgi:hypothetical protein
VSKGINKMGKRDCKLQSENGGDEILYWGRGDGKKLFAEKNFSDRLVA